MYETLKTALGLFALIDLLLIIGLLYRMWKHERAAKLAALQNAKHQELLRFERYLGLPDIEEVEE